MQLNIFDEIFVDNFAGGGGASTGIELAIGRPIDIAINHDEDAIAMHEKNHPYTKHYCESVWDIDPIKVCKGRKVALAWFSPDCKHFSRAKGGKPVSKNIRGLAWVAIRWAATVKPRVIIIENVKEFMTWCPLNSEGYPDFTQKGRTFNSFVNALKAQGYEVQWRVLKACDYGAPTIRERFFLVARCDGQPIVFPAPTHAHPSSEEVRNGKLLPWRTAGECIDFAIPGKSIFNRTKPLAENTQKRIVKGIDKFVIKSAKPFIVYNNTNNIPSGIDEPLRTITTGNRCLLTTPVIVPIGYGERERQTPRVHDISKPLPTIVSSCKQYIAVPSLIQYHSETNRAEVRGQDLSEPILTLDTQPRYALNIAHLVEYYTNDSCGMSLHDPLHTITTKDRAGLVTTKLEKIIPGINLKNWHEVRKLLNKYSDYSIADDEVLIIMVNNIAYFIADISLRMLEPKELYKAQGFPSDYKFEFDYKGKPYSKSAQIARCGNSVCPPMAMALVRVNLPEYCTEKITTMAELGNKIAI